MNTCASLQLGKFSDWYLPEIEDLTDMFGGCDDVVLEGGRGYCNSCADSAGCSLIFGADDAMYYSSSTVDGFGEWIADFRDGRVWLGWTNPDFTRFRCVREMMGFGDSI